MAKPSEKPKKSGDVDTAAKKVPAPASPPAAAPEGGRIPSYVPPPMFLNALVRRERGPNGRDTVSMPVEVYRKLLAAAAGPVFDEQEYLRRNDDVRALVKSKKLVSGLQHFVSDGYAERRASLRIPVDDSWYRATYPDVAREIASGKLKDGPDHFAQFGFHEGRVPAKAYEGEIGEWRELVKKHGPAK